MKKSENTVGNSRFDITDNILILACDVSKDRISLYTETPGGGIDRVFDNKTGAVEKELRQFNLFISGGRYRAAAVAAEPTGVCHDSLFRTARRLGMYTACVSAEAVAKMRVIETNDTGKTDIKDPRVIFTPARIGKTLHHRIFEEPWSLLREWNTIYDMADQDVVQARCVIHSLIKRLFPDFGMKKDFICGKSGKILLSEYGFDPLRITASGEYSFHSTVKFLSPRIREKTVSKIYEHARMSVKRGLSARQSALISVNLLQRFEDLECHLLRKSEARKSMEVLYNEIRVIDPGLPMADRRFITTFHLSRIIGETGPLSDFRNHNKLMRFSGLNLCERQSGLYRGKTHISKRGRPLLRKILKLTVLPPVKKDGICGEYYRKKRDNDKMPGTEALAVAAGHFLKMLYAVYKSGSGFDETRIFVCESQFKEAA
ncbi:MAG: transposase [Desulfobacterales bacterium]